MQVPTKLEYDALKERHAERWALRTCRSATLIQCLKKYDIAPTITVSTPKGKSIVIHASDISAARKRFFASLDLEQDMCHMTAVGDKFVDLFQDWLLNEHTDRYRSITLDAHRKWLRQVIILVVARHLMEQKYALYIAQGSHTFADAWACSEMCRLQLLNNLTSELARLVHHIMRDPEQQQALIDQFHTDLEIRMKGQLFAAPDPLQALPEGVALPFALLTPKREEAHDE
jgi:hypothetical protein